MPETPGAPTPGRQARLAVSVGERYRFETPPGIRSTTTDLEPDEAEELAAALEAAFHGTAATYAG